MNPNAETRIDKLRNANEALARQLRNALRYIEVSVAYRGPMTAAQVEEQIKANTNISLITIGANSCNTLAAVDLHAVRAALTNNAQ